MPRDDPAHHRKRSGVAIEFDNVRVDRFAWRAVAAVALAVLTTHWISAEIGDRRIEPMTVLLESALGIALVAGAILIGCAIPMRSEIDALLRRAAADATALEDRNSSQRFFRDVSASFEMAEDDAELFETAGLALRDAGAGRAEILAADASNAHVRRVVTADGRDAPGCGVLTPRNCPAVRQGHTLKFGDPNGMASCPRLRERSLPDGVVATCIPINVLGTPSAVLHAVTPADAEASLSLGVRALEGVAVRFGQRLGMMRAMSQSQLQAETDPLTGLLNRRAMENRVRQLQTTGQPFAIAMADLDHFKRLNDVHGHDTGDRALRLFARILAAAVRDHDIVCRYGGEEFVVILVGADVISAAPVIHRVRDHLAEALADADLPAFTTSLGLADSTAAASLRDIIQLADAALLSAKAEGRDRLVIADAADEPATAG